MKTLGIGMVGYGFIGKVHTLSYLNLPYYYKPVPARVKMVGVAAKHKENAEEGIIQAGFGFATDNWRDLIDREDIERGQVLAAPGSIKPHTQAEAEVYVLSKEEGGRHTPFFNGYKPQFYIRTTDVTGSIELPSGMEMVMPGDNVTMKLKLLYPVALEKGLRFAIREGGRTVGAGTVSNIIE